MNGNKVTGYTSTYSEDVLIVNEVKKYIRKNGIEKTKTDYNCVLNSWETKSARQIFNEFVEKKLPFSVIEQWNRILKYDTVKFMRRTLGDAVRAVRAEALKSE